LRLGNVRYLTDDVAAAHELFGEARAHAGGDDRPLVEAEQALAFTAMLGGNIPSALEHARSSLLVAQRLDDPRALALAECRVALNEFLSGQGVDRPRFERAIELEEPLDEMPLAQRAKLLSAWITSHPKTPASVRHFLYQNSWIVTGARFGWWHGAEALRELIAADRAAQQRWGIGRRSELVARTALAEVEARVK